jgi:DNA adenine methylase
VLRNPIRYIGAKAALAPKLAAMLPPHQVYVEVFGGAAHLLFRKQRSPIEVYNDLDGRLANLFHVLRDHFDDLAARLRWTLYARSAHAAWRRIGPSGDPIEDALRIFYLLLSSMAGDPSSSWAHSRLRSHAREYEKAKALLHQVAARFQGVAIEQRDFREIIPRWDGPDTVFFCDPPYYGVAGSQFWRFSEKDHADLAALLTGIEGEALVTYYDHPQIRSLYRGWHITEHHRPRRGAAIWGRSTGPVCELIITSYEPPCLSS